MVTFEHADEALEYLKESDIPAAKVKTYADLLDDQKKTILADQYMKATGSQGDKNKIAESSEAYKEHIQFILIMCVLYVVGVWGGPIIYVLYPIALLVLGMKQGYFELFILTIWILILVAMTIPMMNSFSEMRMTGC